MRVRLRYARVGKVRWTSALDVARIWERALRRVGLPLAYTAGFSPRPKIAFGLALPTGHESTAEFVDLDLDDARVDASFSVATLPFALSAALPVGFDVTAAGLIEDREPSLQHQVSICRWEIEVPGVTDEGLAALISAALASETLVVTRTRKGREVSDDIRPSIAHLAPLPAHAAQIAPTASGALLEAELYTTLPGQPRSVRPIELLRGISPELEPGLVRRTHQWIERDGARQEPLAAATDAPHAQARAS
ncbi:MAG: TIGR03936 family radical SAM-associated protein [Acidimicrobiia bacterium]